MTRTRAKRADGESANAAQARPRHAEKLSRERIITAAVALAEREGGDALSMHAVARELGTAAMSLYRHVRNREDLLEGMLDRVALSIIHPDPKADPSEEVVSIFVAIHEAMARAPWTIPILMRNDGTSRHMMPLIERILLALTRLGLDTRSARETYIMLLFYAYGDALARAGRIKSAEDAERPDIYAGFPAIQRTFAGWDAYAETYEANLRRHLRLLADRAAEQDADASDTFN
ncbi:TetR/AcrR family transcriptional regulator [Amorphus orientalis]|uniref:AcrR family transcriptional regulator n=1 Tax=Amorphus orientalis TaxID=649198 RepID=A0AAE4AUK3_9HYPH|nr:TetR/AcrR family transcriptional regulator [Amorphus orientalis]MDQ0317505.1 AcrR family transcriptional regulator [Amorphus orientalis]